MPNIQIKKPLANSLADAFGNKPSVVPQPTTPTPPSTEDSGLGTLFNAFKKSVMPAPTPAPVDPYANFANKATGNKYR